MLADRTALTPDRNPIRVIRWLSLIRDDEENVRCHKLAAQSRPAALGQSQVLPLCASSSHLVARDERLLGVENRTFTPAGVLGSAPSTLESSATAVPGSAAGHYLAAPALNRDHVRAWPDLTLRRSRIALD
jgi:hypothetical protein